MSYTHRKIIPTYELRTTHNKRNNSKPGVLISRKILLEKLLKALSNGLSSGNSAPSKKNNPHSFEALRNSQA